MSKTPMGMRTVYSVVKPLPPDTVRAALDAAMAALPGPPPQGSRWSDYGYEPGSRELVAVMGVDSLTLSDGAWQVAKAIAAPRGLLALELRVQEGDHWDFTLYRGDEVIADFSTSVAYFHGDDGTPRPWKTGNLHAFASAWGVDPARITPYLVDWGSLPQHGLASPGDRYPSGQWEQILDFARAIGVEIPHGHPERFLVQVPCWLGTYRIQPRWRRVIRQLSVWIKGTYPDVPRKRLADRAFGRKRVRVKIIEV